MTKTNLLRCAGFMVVAFSLLAAKFALAQTAAPSRQDLEQQIQQKAAQLDQVNKALQTTQQNLADAKNQRMSLQKELGSLQSNINQLELGIQSDQLTSQKLGLEIDSLNYDLGDIASSLTSKHDSIVQILRELQRASEPSLL